MRKKFFSCLLLGAMCVGFVACESEDPDSPYFTSDKVYIGAVTFNEKVNEFPITNKLNKVKEFIGDQTNESDGTPLCYSMAKGVHLFDEKKLPEFDHIFMLSFTDGKDNTSPDFWLDEGVVTYEEEVYEKAKSELAKYPQLHSYTIGFGTNQAQFSESMATLVQGNGKYYGAKTQNELKPTFNQIAKSMLSSAKNVKLQTLSSNFSQAKPKKFRFVFTVVSSSILLNDTVEANLVGNKRDGFVFTVTKKGNYAQFNNNGAVNGIHNEETGKVEVPLNGMKFIYNGAEQKFRLKILVYNYNSDTWSVEEEESSISESVSNRIGVVVVLDCSRSMGSAFESMQQAAISFIETLTSMTTSSSSSDDDYMTTRDNSRMEQGHAAIDLGLPSGILWAICNVGANSPEKFGNYFAWGETRPKSSYTEDNYSYSGNPDVLPLSVDAAHVNWGGAWRMPTADEFRELLSYENCTWTVTTQSNVNGYRVTSKTNGNSIFIPKAGKRDGSTIYSLDNLYYWSSSDKCYLYYNTTTINFEIEEADYWVKYGSPDISYRGFSVRGVCK